MKNILALLLLSIFLLLCGCGSNNTGNSTFVFENNSDIKITDGGVYTFSGTGNDCQIIVDTKGEVELVLDGVELFASKPLIDVRSAKRVTLTLADASENKLLIESADEDESSAIFSKADLTLGGNGTLTIKSSRDDGIVGKKNISVSGGVYNIDVGHNGIDSEQRITFDGGDFNIKSGNDAIKSENDEPEQASITFNGGSFNISAVDDGVSTTGDLKVNNADINITVCEEGLEGKTVLIEKGNINIVANDDGINARGIEVSEEKYEGANLTVNGGNINIDVHGDGVDSNGDLSFMGGQIFISGAADSGNTSIDFDLNSKLGDATVIATGFSGMFRGFNTASNPTINVFLEEAVADAITLNDSSGNIIISFAPTKEYNHIFISSPSIKLESTYTLKYGEAVLDITVNTNDTVIGNGGFGGFSGGFSGRGPGGSMPDFDIENMPPIKGEFSGDRYNEWEKPPTGQMPDSEGVPPEMPNGEFPEGFSGGNFPEGFSGGSFPDGALPEDGFGGMTPPANTPTPPANTVETYEKSKNEDVKKLLDSSGMIVTNTYHKLDDGSFECGGYNYKYRLDISGRLNNAAKDSRYVILSNTEDITFDQAWRAGGLSSNTNDYFDPKDAIIVERSGL